MRGRSLSRILNLHRLIIQPESRLRKVTAPEIIRQILHQVEVPVMPEKRI